MRCDGACAADLLAVAAVTGTSANSQSLRGPLATCMGTQRLNDERLRDYPCQVAARVPFADGDDHMSLVERRDSREQGVPFIAYALAAAEEAINDSWLQLLGDRLDKTRVVSEAAIALPHRAVHSCSCQAACPT